MSATFKLIVFAFLVFWQTNLVSAADQFQLLHSENGIEYYTELSLPEESSSNSIQNMNVKLVFKNQDIIDQIINHRITQNLNLYKYDNFNTIILHIAVEPYNKVEILDYTDLSADGLELDSAPIKNTTSIYTNFISPSVKEKLHNQAAQLIKGSAASQPKVLPINTSAITIQPQKATAAPIIQKLSPWVGIWKTNAGPLEIKQKNSTLFFTLNGNQFVGTLDKDQAVGKWSGFKLFNSVDEAGEFRFTITDSDTIKIQWHDSVITNWVTESSASKTVSN